MFSILNEDNKPSTISRSVSSNVNKASKLTETIQCLSSNQGTPIADISLKSLVGTCCTLVINQLSTKSGKPYSNIESIIT